MNNWREADQPIAEVYPIIMTTDVGGLADWAVNTLGLTESWRADESGTVEHAEVNWLNGRVSINIRPEPSNKTASIALRVGTNETVEAIYQLAQSKNANFSLELSTSVVAYGFTALDPDGNEWWVHAETGLLDELRNSNKSR